MATANALSLSWDPAVSNRSTKVREVGGLIIDGVKWRGVRYRYLTANPHCEGVDFAATGDASSYEASHYVFYFTPSGQLFERGDETAQASQLDQNCGWLDVGGPVWLDVDVVNSSGQIVRGGLVSEVTLAWTMSFYPTWDEESGKYKLPFAKSYSAYRKVLGLVPSPTPPSGALCVYGFPSASSYAAGEIDDDTSDLAGISPAADFSQTRITSTSFAACYNVNPKYVDARPSPSWTSSGAASGTPLSMGSLFALNLSAENARIKAYPDVFTTIRPVCVLSSGFYVGMAIQA